MHIKSIVAGAALAFALMAGSASAAEPFATLDGVSAQTMSSAELDSVRGEGALGGAVTLPDGETTLDDELSGMPVTSSGNTVTTGDGAAGVSIVAPSRD